MDDTSDISAFSEAHSENDDLAKVLLKKYSTQQPYEVDPSPLAKPLLVKRLGRFRSRTKVTPQNVTSPNDDTSDDSHVATSKVSYIKQSAKAAATAVVSKVSSVTRSTANTVVGAVKGVSSETTEEEDEEEKLYRVTTAQQLRERVLDDGIELRKLDIKLLHKLMDTNNSTSSGSTEPKSIVSTPNPQILNHEVLSLIARRFQEGSTPGNRPANDTARLALSMEGGGMRGAVSAGMAAAIATLGLTDTFDAIYGSSAGSVIGAYMVSRQMCVDVYVDILPAAKKMFVCVNRMLSALAVNAYDLVISRVRQGSIFTKFSKRLPGARSAPPTPGMNISFVLDGIMHHEHGIRPLDLEKFRVNDKKQPLRVAASYVENGKLKTKCFGTKDFFIEDASGDLGSGVGVLGGVKRADGARQGLYACLEASMSVPGATGPPVDIALGGVGPDGQPEIHPFFDAFCFEPIPYRSAVEEGASHVLVLCSRPEGFQPTTKPGMYESGIAPIYFRSHGQPEVARFFEKGGQQYIYAEDLLTLEEGKEAIDRVGGIHVPPPAILHGVDREGRNQYLASHRDEWNRAHLFPLKVPFGTAELSTLEQDRDKVLQAVREGYAAAFDLLAPAIGLELSLSGLDVAELVFPQKSFVDDILGTQLRVEGDEILDEVFGKVENDTLEDFEKPLRWYSLRRVIRFVRRRRSRRRKSAYGTETDVSSNASVPGASSQADPDTSVQSDESMNQAEKLLHLLPGFKGGRMTHLARSLLEEIRSEASNVMHYR